MSDDGDVNDDAGQAAMQALLDRHVKRMEEIADAGYSQVKDASGELLTKLQKAVGLRNIVLDKALTALGVTKPGDNDV